MLQKLGVRTCIGPAGGGVGIDPDGFEIEAIPANDAFRLYGVRVEGDSGTRRFQLGVYRIGLGGQLVKVAGEHD